MVWSLGALSAGFALGYTLGYAHKHTKGAKNQSQVAAFANTLATELSTVGKTMVMPALSTKIKDLFGFDFADLLEERWEEESPKEKSHTETRQQKRS